MPVHSNGYVATTKYGQNHHNHSENSYGGYTDWTEVWPDGGTHTQYTNHWASYSNYSQSYFTGGYYTDYEPYSTFDTSPVISGNTSPYSGSLSAASTVEIDLSGIKYTDASSRVKSKIYYKYSEKGTSYDNLILLGETTSDKYTWVLSDFNPGYYKLFVTMFDGKTWSAIPNAGMTRFVPENIEIGTKGVVSANHSEDTITFGESGIIKVIQYEPPEWLSNTVDKVQLDQLQDEIGKARHGFGLTSFTFSTVPVVKDFSAVTVKDVNKLKESSNAVYKQAKGTDFEFNRDIDEGDVNRTKPINKDVTDIQTLLDSLK